MMLEASTLTLGIATTIFSFYSAGKFARCKTSLSASIGWTLVGEGFMGMVTTIFAFLGLLGILDQVASDIQNGMRIAIFSIASVTTGKLVCELHKAERDD